MAAVTGCTAENKHDNATGVGIDSDGCVGIHGKNDIVIASSCQA